MLASSFTPASNAAVATAPAVSMRSVSLRYGQREVLLDIDLRVATGEFVALVGPSGCGKTSLLRVIGGLVAPTAGSIEVGGRPVNSPRADVAIVFQDYARALLPWRTVRGNIELSLEARGIAKAERAPIVDALLVQLGLEGHAGLYPAQLSGGLQQRVQIARALAQDPDVLLMDEPFGALDAITRENLQDELLAIWGRRRSTILFVTHDLDEALYLGDRVYVLDANPGRVIMSIADDLVRPRHQLETREDPKYLASRHRLHGLLRH
jgi:NitT/TauT family transport system ATP-binding protein